MVRKVANSPGFEPSAKGRVSSKGLSLSFIFVCTLGAAFAWGSSCIASIFLHPHNMVGGPVGPFPPFFLNLAGLEKKNQVPKT